LSSGSGSGNPEWEKMQIGDKHPEKYIFREISNNVLGLKILQFFVADPGSVFFFDPGSGLEKSESGILGSGINIPDPQHCIKLYT
jgi:hypothetical protein